MYFDPYVFGGMATGLGGMMDQMGRSANRNREIERQIEATNRKIKDMVREYEKIYNAYKELEDNYNQLLQIYEDNKQEWKFNNLNTNKIEEKYEKASNDNIFLKQNIQNLKYENQITKEILFNHINFNDTLKLIENKNLFLTELKNEISKCNQEYGRFPHTLIHGSSILLNRTLVFAIANEIQCPITVYDCCSNPNFINTLLKLPDRSIFFLDEIHSLDIPTIENILYHYLDKGIIYLKFPDGQIKSFEVGRRISIIATTNMINKLPNKLQNLFNLDMEIIASNLKYSVK